MNTNLFLMLSNRGRSLQGRSSPPRAESNQRVERQQQSCDSVVKMPCSTARAPLRYQLCEPEPSHSFSLTCLTIEWYTCRLDSSLQEEQYIYNEKPSDNFKLGNVQANLSYSEGRNDRDKAVLEL
jgi:hypothetical protein